MLGISTARYRVRSNIAVKLSFWMNFALEERKHCVNERVMACACRLGFSLRGTLGQALPDTGCAQAFAVWLRILKKPLGNNNKCRFGVFIGRSLGTRAVRYRVCATNRAQLALEQAYIIRAVVYVFLQVRKETKTFPIRSKRKFLTYAFGIVSEIPKCLVFWTLMT